jgi:SNF2 family DNA or RNA helicase
MNGFAVKGSIDVDVDDDGKPKTVKISTGYNPMFIKELKEAFHGSRWNPEGRYWYFPANSRHNLFQLDYLLGNNPYGRYDDELPELDFEPRMKLVHGQWRSFDLYEHQKLAVRHIHHRRQCILAAQMGLGKTLVAIDVMERIGLPSEEYWWVGTKSSLGAFSLERRDWGCRLRPRQLTYEGLVKAAKSGGVPPRFIVFDESQKIKTPTSQRSQAAFHITEAMRNAYGEDVPYIIEMSGTPAPKSPLDWYQQCEVARPGFLREGDFNKYKNRLALYIMKESSLTGGMYPELVTWWDDEDKCQLCGTHASKHDGRNGCAKHMPSENEVARLYRRLNGLVLVQFKKDCLDLPEKVYKVIELEPPPSLLRGAEMIKATAKTAVMALTLLRELSDGFQYETIPTDIEPCKRCKGKKKVFEPVVVMVNPEAPEWEQEPDLSREEYQEVVCPCCDGTGEQPYYERHARHVESPKMEVFEDLLDEFEGINNGRLVTYAGFRGSIDRLVATAEAKGWNWIRVDGRGWHTNLKVADRKVETLLDLFQNSSQERIVYIGHPGSGGIGVTLTASPAIFHYSNDFIPENRMQSDDRIHRPGMDVNLGATIIDVVLLPSDQLILDKLLASQRLQDMSLGQLWDELELAKREGIRVA